MQLKYCYYIANLFPTKPINAKVGCFFSGGNTDLYKCKRLFLNLIPLKNGIDTSYPVASITTSISFSIDLSSNKQ